MLSRREVIGKAAVGAAGVLALGTAGTGLAAMRVPGAAPGHPARDRDRPADNHDATVGHPDAPSAQPAPTAVVSPPPWELVRPLVAGSVVAHGWRLAHLSTVRDGSCVVTLQKPRRGSHRIHLCRNDGTPQGLVYTRRLDLVVMNGGQGDLPTEEGLAQAVAALAHVVAANEATASDAFFADLLPHTERLQRFASAAGPAADGKLR